MKYTIVAAGTLSEFHSIIQIHLDLGWVPQGGIFYKDNTSQYMQAMVFHNEVA